MDKRVDMTLSILGHLNNLVPHMSELELTSLFSILEVGVLPLVKAMEERIDREGRC